MAVTNALSPLAVITALDAVFVQEYEYPTGGPGTATAETPEIFKQVPVSNAAHIEAVLSGGGGFWSIKGEEVPVTQASPRVANKVTYPILTFAEELQISKEFFDDNMHGVWENMVRKFAGNARSTRDRYAFGLYRGAFTTTLTADGLSLINAAHVTIAGPTVSNVIAGNPRLTPQSLNTGIVQMLQMTSQDGIPMGEGPSYLLVAPANFKNAMEITGSQLVSDSSNNAINVYSSTYQLKVFQSIFLSTAQGGNDQAWFLLGRNHGVTRYVREGITTALVDYIYSSNDNYIYKGRYREQVGVTDYVAIVGSNAS